MVINNVKALAGVILCDLSAEIYRYHNVPFNIKLTWPGPCSIDKATYKISHYKVSLFLVQVEMPLARVHYLVLFEP